jgi:hypothetical protein
MLKACCSREASAFALLSRDREAYSGCPGIMLSVPRLSIIYSILWRKPSSGLRALQARKPHDTGIPRGRNNQRFLGKPELCPEANYSGRQPTEQCARRSQEYSK